MPLSQSTSRIISRTCYLTHSVMPPRSQSFTWVSLVAPAVEPVNALFLAGYLVVSELLSLFVMPGFPWVNPVFVELIVIASVPLRSSTASPCGCLSGLFSMIFQSSLRALPGAGYGLSSSLVKQMTPDLGPDLRRAWKAVRFYDLDACQFGGKRKKRTRLASSIDLSHLARDCDGLHPHLPWSIQQDGDRLQFATAEEAQCPMGLCRELASLVQARLTSSNYREWGPDLSPPFASGPGSRVPPLIPQFRTVQFAEVAPKVTSSRPWPGLFSWGKVTRPGHKVDPGRILEPGQNSCASHEP